MEDAAQHVARSIQQTPNLHFWDGQGFLVDGALLGAAPAAWLLDIEHLIGGVLAAIIGLSAVGASVYRMLYWRRKWKHVGSE